MSTLIVVLEKALPVFVMLALGMLCRRKGILSREGISSMKTFAVNITLPAVMFSAFATAQYSAESLFIPLVIFMLCVASLALGFALCAWGLLAPVRAVTSAIQRLTCRIFATIRGFRWINVIFK